MTLDESGAPDRPFMQNGGIQPPIPQQNNLGRLMQGAGPPTRTTFITKHQLIAGLHHLSSFQKEFAPLLKSDEIGKTSIRPKIFDASAALIGQGIFSVPEVMNGIKDFPDDPADQKRWLQIKLGSVAQAEKKLVSDYISQGPGPEPDGPEWSLDNHKTHMTDLMRNYKR
jgi:hypothetical protein